jgi:hypothetical protein
MSVQPNHHLHSINLAFLQILSRKNKLTPHVHYAPILTEEEKAPMNLVADQIKNTNMCHGKQKYRSK